jgi:hypothetical protein
MSAMVRSRLGAGAVVAAVVGLGLGVASLLPNAEGAPSPAPVREDSEQLQQQIDSLYRQFAGTVYERDAAGVVQAYRMNGEMDACMEQEGYPEWDWSLPRSKNPPSAGFWTSMFFERPMSAPHSTTVLATGPAVVAEHRTMMAEIPEDLRQVINSCSGRTKTGEAEPTPPVAMRLKNQWWDLLRDIDARYGDYDQYRECLTNTNFGELGRITNVTDAAMALERLDPPAAELGDGTPQDSAAWQRMVEAEEVWDQGDYNCRFEVYNRHLADAVAAAEEFARTNAAEIAEARAAWRQVVADAEKLGYDGTYVSLGAD